MHYIPIIDPGISGSEAAGTYPPFDVGLEMNIFIRNSTDQPFVGKVWNRVSTVWPDFTHPNATLYWTKMIRMFHEKVRIKKKVLKIKKKKYDLLVTQPFKQPSVRLLVRIVVYSKYINSL
jgi:alpha-glucosidase (family GH31 glycosyl hydrolase)